MLIRVNNDLERKLSKISKESKVPKDEMLQKILNGFVTRYESKHGPIMLTTGKRRNKLIWDMYEFYKACYQQIYEQPYSVTPDQERHDFKYLKDIQKKIITTVANKAGKDVISIADEDLFGAFQFFLLKMPQWWKENAFQLKVLNGKFDEILKNINHGKQRGKDALDDFISKF